MTVQMWRGARNQLVGWFDRHMCRLHSGQFEYLYPEQLDSMPHYSLILTKAAVMHHKYLAAYSTELPQWIRDHVAEHTNCEDIAMQFLVSNKTGEPPWHIPNDGLTFRCALYWTVPMPCRCGTGRRPVQPVLSDQALVTRTWCAPSATSIALRSPACRGRDSFRRALHGDLCCSARCLNQHLQ